MGCVECGTHEHVPCVSPLDKEEGVLSDPSYTATGRFRVQSIYFCFWKTNYVCAYVSARPNPLLKEVAEKRVTGVEIIYKQLVACAKQLCQEAPSQTLNWAPCHCFLAASLHLQRCPKCTYCLSLQEQNVYIPREQAYFSCNVLADTCFWGYHPLINGNFLAKVKVPFAGIPHLHVQWLYFAETIKLWCFSSLLISSIVHLLLRWRERQIRRNFFPVMTFLGKGKL